MPTVVEINLPVNVDKAFSMMRTLRDLKEELSEITRKFQNLIDDVKNLTVDDYVKSLTDRDLACYISNLFFGIHYFFSQISSYKEEIRNLELKINNLLLH